MSDPSPAARVLNGCPYQDCASSDVNPSPDGTEPRPPDHSLMRCVACFGYSVRALNGFVYPFMDKTNPDDDPVKAVH